MTYNKNSVKYLIWTAHDKNFFDFEQLVGFSTIGDKSRKFHKQSSKESFLKCLIDTNYCILKLFITFVAFIHLH